MTFLDLAEKVLAETGIPMTPGEIWNKAIELGLDHQLGSLGKTPVNTLNAQLGNAVQKLSDGRFERTGKPYRYFLKGAKPKETTKTDIIGNQASYGERDLHPLLVRFARYNDHFRCFVKTIFHETSTKGLKGEYEWLHPDLVGFYFPYDTFKRQTIELLGQFNQNQYRLFSFEMKKEVNYGNLREYYFQAVSNSSWANEGYLVALHFDNNPKLQEELARLNQAFGIGVIELDPVNVESSRILHPARLNEVDWITVNRLVEVNKSFLKFVESVEADIRSRYPHPSEYDQVLDSESMEEWIRNRGIR